MQRVRGRVGAVAITALCLGAAGFLPGQAVTRPGGIQQVAAPQGCLERVDEGPDCRALGPVDDPGGIVVSPDGKHVYVSGTTSSTVVAYRRNATTGGLIRIQCIAWSITPGCAVVRGLGGPTTLTMTPDGKTLYAVASFSNSIARLTVAADGTLTQPAGAAGCIDEAGDEACTDGRELLGASDLAVSPDGKSAYVAAAASSSLTAFTVGAGGLLTQVAGAQGCFTAAVVDGCTTWARLGGASQVEALGNTLVLVAAYDEGSLTAFQRNSQTGALLTPEQRQCLDAQGEGGCNSAPGLAEPGGMAAASGRVYVSSEATARLSKVRVDGTGILSLAGCANSDAGDGCKLARAVEVPASVAVAGGTVYLADSSAGSLTAYDTVGAALTQRVGPRGCVVDETAGPTGGCASGIGLEGASVLALSPDAKTLYAGGFGRDTVAVFDRDSAAPRCAGVRARTTKGHQVTVKLECTDADGDKLRLSIVKRPSHGTLGPLNQRRDTVRFTPKPRFTGTTTFTYQATALGVPSRIATVRLKVTKP